MAYIQPSGTIEVMKNVTLTPDYENTLWFESPQAQYQYFSNKISYTFNNQMYTRVSNGVCRLYGQAELLKDCNYMRFNNNLPSGAGVNTKTYYAFITNVEYINNEVTEISFVIDEIQTWFFETVFMPCMIERQHSVTDQWAYNLVPEDLSVNEYVTNSVVENTGLHNYCYLLGVDFLAFPDSEASGSLAPIFTHLNTKGTYTGTRWIGFPKSSAGESNMQAFINTLASANTVMFGNFCKINRLYLVPTNLFFSTPPTDADTSGVLVGSSGNRISLTVNRLRAFKDERGLREDYEPKNNKMLTFPFVQYCIDGVTSKDTYKYENNTSSALSFGSTIIGLTGNVSDKPYVLVYNLYYDGEYASPEYTMVIDDFPSLPISINNLDGVLVRETISALTQLAKSYFQFEFGEVGRTESVKTMTESVQNKYGKGKTNKGKKLSSEKTRDEYSQTYPVVPMIQKKSMHLPEINLSTPFDSINGSATSLLPMMAHSGLEVPYWNVRVLHKQIKYDFAVMYDQYLSKFGYSQHTINVPNIHARENWTYVKTDGCVVKGLLPTNARDVIESALDRGITYWANGDVGNYGDFTNPEIGG